MNNIYNTKVRRMLGRKNPIIADVGNPMGIAGFNMNPQQGGGIFLINYRTFSKLLLFRKYEAANLTDT